MIASYDEPGAWYRLGGDNAWVRAESHTPTESPDERNPAPEEDIQETTETVEETLEPAPRDPDDDPDEDDE
jgi:hypothetical protein